ncbi:MAG TPA: response regulator [Nitrospira sp.]|nr:response regulator [Nitrospira sp.]
MSPFDASSRSGAGQTILAVDDDPDALKLCRLFLEKAGFSVLAASGSSEALKICKNHEGPIHLLVTDLVLPPPEFSFASGENEFPHVHGHDLAVRALRMRKDLRVILMSANIEKELQGYGIRAESLPFIPKPLEAQGLLTLVNQTLQAPPPTPESLIKESRGGAKGTDEWFD